MKHTIHSSTGQYEFVETEIDPSKDEIDAATEMHSIVVKLMKGGADAVGMDTKEFNAVLDELLTTNAITGDPGMMERMNASQQEILQAVKRSRARTKEKMRKDILEAEDDFKTNN